MMDDLIRRQDAIDVAKQHWYKPDIAKALEELPSAYPDRLTDDDFETIRIHLNARKEALCNQHRWKEAEEYQRIIDRFVAFASGPTIEPRERGHWKPQNVPNVYGYNPAYSNYNPDIYHCCSKCGANAIVDDCGDELLSDFCYNCGADMREENDGRLSCRLRNHSDMGRNAQ